MAEIYSIHDKTFKNVMSDIRVARDFFEEYLPESVLAIANLNTLKLSQNSFVDDDLKAFSSDILYEVELKNGNMAYIYLLCEHKSSIDRLMPFTLLNYMVKIWHCHLKQTGSESLPLIFPLVFYHGKKPYDGCRTLSELIQGPPDLVQEVLFKPFHLIDTHDIQDEDLREKRWVGILTFIFKHVYARDVWPYAQLLIELLKGVQGEAGVALFTNTLLKYWLQAAEIREKDPKVFIETVQQGLSVPIGGEVMTMAEQLIQQGVQKGEGNLLIRLLECKFKTIPECYKQKIEQANPDNLLKWGEKMLDSQALEEVFSV